MSRQNQRYAARLRKLDRILANLPDSQYNHADFIESQDKASCNTVGCAMGHAVVSGQFPGLKVRYNGPGLRGLEAYSFESVGDYAPNPDDWMPVLAGMRAWANHYFGPGTYNRIFDANAYGDDGYDDFMVTKSIVRERIAEVAAEFEKA